MIYSGAWLVCNSVVVDIIPMLVDICTSSVSSQFSSSDNLPVVLDLNPVSFRYSSGLKFQIDGLRNFSSAFRFYFPSILHMEKKTLKSAAFLFQTWPCIQLKFKICPRAIFSCRDLCTFWLTPKTPG